MMKFILVFAFLFYCFFVSAQTVRPTDNGSEVLFSINNFGLSTKGKLTGLTGSIIWSPEKLQTTQFDVSVASKTINTNNQLRDGHLQKTDYFDVEKFPIIQIRSKQITANKQGEYIMEAMLTIKGVTKIINIPFSAQMKNGKPLFESIFEINRRDFSIGGGSISLSNTVKISLRINTY